MGQRSSLILAVSAFITSACFYYYARSYENEALAMENTKTSTVAQVKKVFCPCCMCCIVLTCVCCSVVGGKERQWSLCRNCGMFSGLFLHTCVRAKQAQMADQCRVP